MRVLWIAVSLVFMGAAHAQAPDPWKAIFESTFTLMGDRDDEGDGVVRYIACFKPGTGKNKCDAVAFVRRDGFRKVNFLVPGLRSEMLPATYVKTYISILDNQRPAVFFTPYFLGKNGWLFMNKVSIMVNGEVVIEKDLDRSSVDRNVESHGVEEKGHFAATDAQIAALRKVKPDSDVNIRLTGSKGYVSLRKIDIQSFKGEVENLLFIYDSINRALDAKR